MLNIIINYLTSLTKMSHYVISHNNKYYLLLFFYIWYLLIITLTLSFNLFFIIKDIFLTLCNNINSFNIIR